MTIAPNKRFRKKQGFENSLFGRLGGSLKQRPERQQKGFAGQTGTPLR